MDDGSLQAIYTFQAQLVKTKEPPGETAPTMERERDSNSRGLDRGPLGCDDGMEVLGDRAGSVLVSLFGR